MLKTKDLITYFLFVVILFPIIFGFPSTDLSIYLQAGKTILDGEKIYVDFIDIKTPIFFTFYAIITLIVNNSQSTFYLFSYLVFVFTAIGLYHFVKKEFDYNIALFSSLTYAVSLLITGFSLYIHLEVLFGFFFLILIIFYSNTFIFSESKILPRTTFRYLVFGFVLGLIISIKYSFFIIFIPFFLLDLFFADLSKKDFIKKQLVTISSISITFIFAHFWLIDREIFNGYLDTLKSIAQYASYPPISAKLFRDIVKTTGQFFGDHFSLLLTSSAFLGVLNIFSSKWTKKQKLLLFTSLLLVGFFLISIYIERKLIIYHFARLLIPLSILTGVGLVALINVLKENWFTKDKLIFIRTIIVAFVIFLITIGPLARFVGIIRFPYHWYMGKEEFYRFVDEQRPQYFNYTEKLTLTSFINKHYPSTSKTLIISIGSFDLIYELHTKVIKKLPQRNLFLPYSENNVYYNSIIEIIKNVDLIILQKNDGIFENLTGNTKSSYELAMEDENIRQIITSQFNLVYDSNVYAVFSKK